MSARNVMVTRLVTLSAKTDVFDAIARLLLHRVSGAPVVDEDGRYLGVFSEKCCMRALLDAASDLFDSATVADYMDCKAPTIDEGTDLLTIARVFHGTPRRRLPVVREGKVVGQISRRDVLRAAHDMLSIAPDRETGLANLCDIFERRPVAE
jgi:CBS domain-containing protein